MPLHRRNPNAHAPIGTGRDDAAAIRAVRRRPDPGRVALQRSQQLCLAGRIQRAVYLKPDRRPI